jgi:hypothetical protein
LDRLIALAHPELVRMRQELKDLPFLDYAEPIELAALRQKAAGRGYASKQEMAD